MSLGMLSLGFVIGMRHALESDHIAAVASLATRSHTVADTIRQGAAWGIGHTLTLFLSGLLVLLLDSLIPETVARTLELMVGIMLVGLGADVLNRLLRHRGDRSPAYHALDPRRGPEHDLCHHLPRLPFRALLVGMMHGMAGSAALILLTLSQVQSPLAGMAYITLFGIGSIAGMAALSAIIALPLHYSAVTLERIYTLLRAGIGIVTLLVGCTILYGVATGGGTG